LNNLKKKTTNGMRKRREEKGRIHPKGATGSPSTRRKRCGPTRCQKKKKESAGIATHGDLKKRERARTLKERKNRETRRAFSKGS